MRFKPPQSLSFPSIRAPCPGIHIMILHSPHLFDPPVLRMWYGKVVKQLSFMMDTTHILDNHGSILHSWALALGGYVSCVPFWLHYYFSLVVCFSCPLFPPRLPCCTLRWAFPPPPCSCVLRSGFPIPLIWLGEALPVEAVGAPHADPEPGRAFDWWTRLKTQLTPIAQSPLQNSIRNGPGRG
jgi:hypothetical protein